MTSTITNRTLTSAQAPSIVVVDDEPEGPAQPNGAQAPDLPRRHRRANLLVEAGCLVFLIWIYEWLQDLSPIRRHLALRDARDVLEFEHRLGFAPEHALNQWLAHQHVLAFLASNFYSNAIFVVTFATAAVLYWRRPDLYKPLRNMLVLTNMMAFAAFWAFPVAPPRMMPGFIDVVQKAGGIGSWHSTLVSHADQVAAMPSMHLGYAVWCAIVAWRMARTPRAKFAAASVGTGYCLLTTLVVVGTGNHYVADVVAGTACTFLALFVVNMVRPLDLAALWACLRPQGQAISNEATG